MEKTAQGSDSSGDATLQEGGSVTGGYPYTSSLILIAPATRTTRTPG